MHNLTATRQTFSQDLTFLGHPASLSKSWVNYGLQPSCPRQRKREGREKTATRIALSREVSKRKKFSFQWSSAETKGISLRRRQRLTVNSDVRTHGVWRGCALACERANERVGKREMRKRKRERGREGKEGKREGE